MPSRGTYRGVYSSLVDDLDFQQLTPEARLVFHTIRVSSQIGPAGIFRYYIGPLSEQSGLSERKVERCLQELERPKPRQTLGWIVREGGILWVVNALRYDPNMHLRDEKHLKSVLRALSSLPQQKIVLRFCDWYRITPPFTKDEMMISHPSSDHLFASNSNVSKVSRSGDITSCNTRESERPFDGPSEGLREKSESDSPRTSMRTKKTEDEKEDEYEDEKDTTMCLAVRDTNQEWPSPESLQALYNQEAPKYLPRAETLNKQRRDSAKKYLGLYPDQSWWMTVFDQYRHSRFLMGMGKRNGHESFLPDFDFLLRVGKDKIDNCVKVHDGKYRDSTIPLSPMGDKTKDNLAVVQRFSEGSTP